MITYVYIVKCPECEDEFFDFFDEAKEFAMSCLSKKPIITQTEVTRNDFGECTDHCDLGTVWSCEDVIKNPDKAVAAMFSKDDINSDYNPDKDPEFQDDDFFTINTDEPAPVAPAIEPKPEPADARKPIPDDMTIDQLKEAMEENEDTVECAGCEELFDKSECRKEVDLGWLCSRCEMAIKSRGETLTFKEGNYWDFLDEDLNEEMSFEDLVRDSINHLVNDLGKDPWAEDFADDVIADLENNYENEVPEDMTKYNSWCSAVACEVSRQVNNPDNLTEASLADIAAAANSEFGSDWNSEDLLDKAGIDDFRRVDLSTGMTPSEKAEYNRQQAEIAWARDRERAYKNKLANWKRYKNSKLEELEEAADYKKRLTPCPECGTEEAFDPETGICIECGFN